MKIYLKISYDGSKFFGFQQQNKTQNTIMNKLILTCKSLNINSTIVGSGRTDKGVHANIQALHVSLPSFWNDLNALKYALNKQLHPFIHVKQIYPVCESFHARFDAIKREYRYIFSHEIYNPILSSYVVFRPSFDMQKLNEILKHFEGVHDFEYFKKNGSDTKNFIREIYKFKAIKYKNKTIICIQANGFLRSQIRMMINFALKVYEEKLSIENLQEQLSKKTIHSQTLSPPNGLYLHRIFYKNDIYLH